MKMNFVLLFLLTAQICVAQEQKFFDAILSYDRCRYCYFLSIDVESKHYSGKIVIENDDLFNFLNKTRGFNKPQYREFVRDLLTGNKKLVLDQSNVNSDGTFLKIKDVSEHEFRIVNEIPEIDAIAAHGCVAFVRHYFLAEPLEKAIGPVFDSCDEFIRKQNENLLLRNGLSTMETSIVINKLFGWKIPTRIDDYSGALIIEKVNFSRSAR